MTLPSIFSLILIAAIAENGAIGRDNRLLWRLKTDLARFKALTIGKPVIMGRKTYASIGKALPRRDNIVLTRDASFQPHDASAVRDWPAALSLSCKLAADRKVRDISVIGGAEIYALALPEASHLRLTLVHIAPDADAFFPPFDRSEFEETAREDHLAGPDDDYPFTFIDLRRRVDRPAD